MASTFKPQIQIFTAGAAIAKGNPVKFDSVDNRVIKAVLSTDKIIGWAQGVASALGDLIEVALPGGGAKALCGAAAVTRGDLLTADSTGAALSTTTANDRLGGVAMQNAVSGDLFDVFVQVGNY